MTEPTFRTFSAHVEDKPGVLTRVISMFRRRGYNIESLTVGRSEQPGISRITMVVRATPDTARLMQANLYKLVDVLHVEDLTHHGALVRELALVKVKAPHQRRAELLQLCEAFRARVLDVSPEATTVEVTGPIEKIDALIAVLQPFGIIELARTGAVAMTRAPAASLPPPLDADGRAA